MDKNTISQHDKIIDKLANLSNEEFLNLGTDGLSYIKPVGKDEDKGEIIYALHSANGSHIATGQDLAVLKSIAAQNELSPMSMQ